MPWGLIEIYMVLPAFVVVLARVAGMMLAVPLFSGGAIPIRLKALFVIAVTAAVFPMMVRRVTFPATISEALAGVVGELFLGLLIGMSVSAVLLGVQLAIQLVSQQAGIALGEVFNPALDTQMSVVAELYYYMAMVVFLAIGGHRAVVATMLDSFEIIPPLGFTAGESVAGLVVDLFAVAFMLAIRAGGPVLLAMLLGLATLGFVSRALPQLNLLSIGFPAKILVALVLMAWSVTALGPLLTTAFSEAIEILHGHLLAGTAG